MVRLAAAEGVRGNCTAQPIIFLGHAFRRSHGTSPPTPSLAVKLFTYCSNIFLGLFLSPSPAMLSSKLLRSACTDSFPFVAVVFRHLLAFSAASNVCSHPGELLRQETLRPRSISLIRATSFSAADRPKSAALAGG